MVNVLPFKAYVNDKPIVSSFISKDEWDEIKKTKPSIKMCCCGNTGYMKRNNYGTQFFVHKRIGNCNYQPESKEHLFLKDKIAKICKESGCEIVDVERVGTDWKADVYVEQQDKKYAFEVQLSKTTFDILKERSEKYIRDGIQPVWIIKKNENFEQDYKTRYILRHLEPDLKLDDYLFYFKNYGILINSITDFDGILQNKIEVDTFDQEFVDLAVFINEIVSGIYIQKCDSKINEIWELYELIDNAILEKIETVHSAKNRKTLSELYKSFKIC